jgi:hypothetical protein
MEPLADYRSQMVATLRERIARQFPLLEQETVNRLVDVLLEDRVPHGARFCGWLFDQLGSNKAVLEFIRTYWPSREEIYKSWCGRKRR